MWKPCEPYVILKKTVNSVLVSQYQQRRDGMFDIQYFAQMLQKARKEQGLTQSELADKLLVSSQSVSYWECGKGMPDISHLCMVADILDTSLDKLLRKPHNPRKGLIGIDGGGTKTEFLLIDEKGTKLNSVILDGCNPNTCGIQESIRIVRQGIDMLRPNTMNAVGIFLGGAGFDIANHAEMMVDALREAYPGLEVGCANDIYNVLACSAQPDNCIAAISGTGCIVYSSHNGSMRRVGGLGYLFECCGSGYDIGRDAISAALWARDGTGESTLLTGLVEEKLGGPAWEYIDQLYRSGVSYIASFAPLVAQAAQQNDRVALNILERSSTYMVRMLNAARTHAPEARNVVLSGSLFSKNDMFFNLVAERLDPDLILERVTWPPVWGACLQCAKLCGLEEMPSLQVFLESSH